MNDQETQASRDVVFFLLLAIFTSVGLYDVIATRIENWESVSDLIREWSKKWPVIAFMAGFLCGHLWG